MLFDILQNIYSFTDLENCTNIQEVIVSKFDFWSELMEQEPLFCNPMMPTGVTELGQRFLVNGSLPYAT